MCKINFFLIKNLKSFPFYSNKSLQILQGLTFTISVLPTEKSHVIVKWVAH